MKEIIGYGILGMMGLVVLYFFTWAWKEELFRFLVFMTMAWVALVGLVILALWLIGVQVQ